MTSLNAALRIPLPRIRHWRILASIVMGMLFQYTAAAVYDSLIVQTFGGTAEAHVTSSLQSFISYFMTGVACAACAIYCSRRHGPSRILVVVHLVAVIVPLQALVAAQYEFASSAFATAIALCYVGTLALAASFPELRVPPPGAIARATFFFLAGCISLFLYGSLLVQGGFRHLSFDLLRVYTVRSDFLRTAPPLAGYLVPWQGYVLNPTVMLIALRKRSLLLGLPALALQLLLFGATGYKTTLFVPALLLAFYVIALRRDLTNLVFAGSLGVIGLALALYALTGATLVPAILVDRLFLAPAEVHYWYYDFFGVHNAPFLQLTDSIFSWLASSPFHSSVAEVIGSTYLNRQASANVGVFGNAFANFGYPGCVIFAILLALVLLAIDAAGSRAPPRVATGLMAMPAFALVNSGLLTNLLTDGLALAILTLWVVSDRGNRHG